VINEASKITNPSPADVCDPILLEALCFDGFDEICDAAGTAVLHHQPQLIILQKFYELVDLTRSVTLPAPQYCITSHS
jgi:hypothetical protein